MMKQLRVTVDGKIYDVLVETFEGAQAPTVSAPVPQYVQPSQPIAAPAPSPSPAAFPAPVAATGGAPVPSPLSGTVIDIHVKEGQAVKEGDLLITLEAMKMNTPINAPHAGTVRAITVQKGGVIEEGAPLLTLA